MLHSSRTDSDADPYGTTALALFATASVTLDANGNGTIYIGPNGQGEQWHVTNVAVNTSTATNKPKAYVFRNSIGAFTDGTNQGNLDSSNTDYQLMSGERLIIVWNGGDAGATATVTLQGTKFLRGRVAY